MDDMMIHSYAFYYSVLRELSVDFSVVVARRVIICLLRDVSFVDILVAGWGDLRTCTHAHTNRYIYTVTMGYCLQFLDYTYVQFSYGSLNSSESLYLLFYFSICNREITHCCHWGE